MSARRTFAKAVGSTQSHPFPVGVKPAEADVEIAQTIAHHTSPVPEEIANRAGFRQATAPYANIIRTANGRVALCWAQLQHYRTERICTVG
jgi:hypothetical protein